MRKLISISFFLIFLLFSPVFVYPVRADTASNGAQDKIEINLFYSQTCPHCAAEREFLKDLQGRYPEIQINQYEVIYDQGNQELLKDFYQRYQMPKNLQGLVPATFTPEKYFVGFNQEIAEELESCLDHCLRPDREDISLISTSLIERDIKIPFLGEIKLSSLSFPAMAVLLGTLDGFNVCSLGALILILSLVLSLNSRRKVLLFGGVFILTTAVVYGLLIVFWYKLFEFIASYLKMMEILIGTLGLAGGVYFLKQFIDLRKKGPTCDSEVGGSIVSKFSNKVQNLLKESSTSRFFLLIGAIFSFALVITVVEFPCSAVVPVAFAAVLAGAGLSTFHYLLYIAIFVAFYLLDEIIMFLVALFTSRIWLSSPKFLKWIILAEAVILFFLGFYYLSGILG